MGSVSRMPTTCDGSKPRSIAVSVAKLRIMSPAPTSSTSASATSDDDERRAEAPPARPQCRARPLSATSADRPTRRAAPAPGRRRCRSRSRRPSRTPARADRRRPDRCAERWSDADATNALTPHHASSAPSAPPPSAIEHALGEDLLRDPPAARAERFADRDLALPGVGTGEHQVREIRAGDQQHEADGADAARAAPAGCSARSARSTATTDTVWSIFDCGYCCSSRRAMASMSAVAR